VTSALPDAAPGNWVDRLAPPPLRPWLRLARLDRPTGIWLLMLPGWQGIALADATVRRLPDMRLLALFFAGALLMRSAGCAYNDVVDRDLDAKVARTAGRPVASGQIGVKAALAFVALCCLASLAILLSLNAMSIALGVASLALVAAYPFMKRITWWPQAWLGLTFNWGALLAFAAVAAPTSLAAWIPALLLYAGGVAWTLGYDTVYAVQDLEDDALAGVKSSARRLGAATRPVVAGFYLAAVALTLAASFAAHFSTGWYSVWAPMAVYAAVLLRQPLRLQLDNPTGALALFRSNTYAGLILFLAVAVGAVEASLAAFQL
jgi:4-hydroxybenzoate polyprenyltransferase